LGKLKASLVPKQKLEIGLPVDRSRRLSDCLWAMEGDTLRQLDHWHMGKAVENVQPERVVERPYLAKISTTVKHEHGRRSDESVAAFRIVVPVEKPYFGIAKFPPNEIEFAEEYCVIPDIRVVGWIDYTYTARTAFE